MGDRCTIRLTFRKADEAQLARHFAADPGQPWYDDIIDEDATARTVEIQEYNYGALGPRQEAAAAGIALFGDHDAGGTYGPAAFASADGEFADVLPDSDGNPTVPMQKDGTFRDQDSEDARRYLRILARAQQIVGIE